MSIEPVKHLIERLERLEAARLVVLTWMCLVSMLDRTREYCTKLYATCEPSDNRPEHIQSKLFGAKLKRRRIPPELRVVSLFRTITTIWLVYVVAKFAIVADLWPPLSGPLRGLELAPRCYLVGRYILLESVGQVTAALFAAAHLVWRLIQWTVRPYPIHVLHFLLIEPRELELIYSKLDGANSLTLDYAKHGQLTGEEMFLLDTMCHCERTPSGLVYRLRANRNRSALGQLSRRIAQLALAACTLVAVIALSLTVAFTYLILSDEHYLRAYGDCNPHLRRTWLELGGRAQGWTMTFNTWHRLLASLADGAENAILWTEGGLCITTAPVLCYTIAFDLMLNWRGIEAKMEQLETMMAPAEHDSNQRSGSLIVRLTRQRLALSRDRQIRELIVEVKDFFDQVALTNPPMTYFINAGLGWCLFLCGLYTYYLQVNSGGQVPVSLVLIYGYLVACMTGVCFSLLALQAACLRSYPKFCSLMARDGRKLGHKYGLVMELYVRKRSCFTLLGQYPFETTTFITVIGWAFSCFFVITSLLRRFH